MNQQITRDGELVIGSFRAMASPCEVLIESDDDELAAKLVRLARDEAKRIEQKFSRYRNDNIVYTINHSDGKPVTVDAETARLLDFADNCYTISSGLFDVTSGILRKAWSFDGSNQIPQQSLIDSLLESIGWSRVRWNNPQLVLPAGMEIDLGGIGKEYAVDRALDVIGEHSDTPVLVNFGGDLHCSGPRNGQRPWYTGIENPNHSGQASDMLELYRGALATSGDAFRFIEIDGQRYSHILNPTTGWPEPDAPRSVTVASATCTEAGILATLGMLHGSEAEEFLNTQQVKYRVLR